MRSELDILGGGAGRGEEEGEEGVYTGRRARRARRRMVESALLVRVQPLPHLPPMKRIIDLAVQQLWWLSWSVWRKQAKQEKTATTNRVGAVTV